MKDFANLITLLDQTTSLNKKKLAIIDYLQVAQEEDKLWALALLSGRKIRSIVSSTRIREWATEASGIPQWLFEECYYITGDLGETISHLVSKRKLTNQKKLSEIMFELLEAGRWDDDKKKKYIVDSWSSFDPMECFVFNKLITGNFRIGVSSGIVTRAIAEHLDEKPEEIAHRLMGTWDPAVQTFTELLSLPADLSSSTPYPFYLAYALDQEPSALGNEKDWIAEWKWDGIRSQLIKRNGQLFIWSRGEDLITDRFPELKILEEWLPDGTVIDGELMPYKDGKPMAFNDLQTRLGRKNISTALIQKVPVHIFAYDILEWKGEDIRTRPISERKAVLEALISSGVPGNKILLSHPIQFNSWEELMDIRKGARENFSEGIMLKKADSIYDTGRKKGSWWKWKIDPLSVDAVLIYAQKGHGRRADLFTDYTFAVWKDQELVPFAKAYSGLTDAEIYKVDSFIRKNTIEKFGPVRSVTPALVFEIGFEGIASSPRHKSGISVRFPRILRWRDDKPVEEADTIETLYSLLKAYGG